MNSILPLARLAELLAAKTGHSVEQTTAYITEIFADAEARLASDGHVTLPGIGTLRITADKDDFVSFVPDKSLAMAANEPFSAFTPIPLSPEDNVEGDMPPTPPPFTTGPESAPVDESVIEVTDSIEVLEETESEISAQVSGDIPENIPSAHSEEVHDDMPPAYPAAVVDEDEVPPVFNIDGPEDENVSPPPVQSVQAHGQQQPVSTFRGYTPPPGYTPNHNHEDKPSRKRRKVWPWVILGIFVGLILGFICGFIVGRKFVVENDFYFVTDVYPDDRSDVVLYDDESETLPDREEVEDLEQETDSVMTLDTAPDTPTSAPETKSDVKTSGNAPRYDKITSTIFLTTLSRRYYGEMEYWVYIYDANDLGNPNRIDPGTKVRVPYPEELPLTGDRDTDIANAKKRSAEIYAQYSK